MTVKVTPKPESYVTEWEAVQITGSASHGAIRRLTKNTPWNVQMTLDEDSMAFVFTQVVGGSVEQWRAEVGSWVVRSPHGRFWFMSDGEFHDQFDWEE